jgi:hypothetical protein
MKLNSPPSSLGADSHCQTWNRASIHSARLHILSPLKRYMKAWASFATRDIRRDLTTSA